ncbi:MAG: CHAT domain-containing protein [Magnetococcales bacterium]|nr:CHAT domain-containing protein [Magnetococcales bacterium]
MMQTIDMIRKLYPECARKGVDHLESEILREDLIETVKQVGHPVVYLTAGRDQGAVIFVYESGFAAIPLPLLGENPVREKVKELSEHHVLDETSSEKRFREYLPGLCEWLWESAMGSIVEWLSTRARKKGETDLEEISIVACGTLGIFPWHAARDRGSKKFAIMDICISFVPTIRTLHTDRSREGANAPQSVLSVGTVAETKGQAKTIAKLFGATPLTKKDRTRNGVLGHLSNKTAIHFACHGLADLKNPLESRLFLSRNEELKVRDILSVQNRLSGTELVSLSACETALRSIVISDEAVSLPSSLLQSGAKTVVAPLWKVRSDHSEWLMQDLYRIWRQNNAQTITPAQALRYAQIEMIHQQKLPTAAGRLLWNTSCEAGSGATTNNDLSHPYVWAAYQAFGSS